MMIIFLVCSMYYFSFQIVPFWGDITAKYFAKLRLNWLLCAPLSLRVFFVGITSYITIYFDGTT